MSLLSRLGGSLRAAVLGRERAAAPGGDTIGFWLSEVGRRALLGSNGLPSGSPYGYHTWVHTCVSVRANAVRSIPFGIYTGAKDSKKPVLTGPWVDLFRRPAPGLTGADLFEITETYLCLPGGECFWVLEGVGDDLAEGEVPALIYPLRGGAYARPMRSGKEIVGWQFRVKGQAQPLEIPAHRVIQFRYFNPDDPERGISPLDAAMLGVESDALAANWNRSFFLNSATPNGIVSYPVDANPSDKQLEQNRLEWNDQLQGSSKAFRTKFLRAGATYQKVAETHVEMGFEAQRKWSRDEVAAVYQVPQFFLGLTADLKYATAVESRRVLYESTIFPECDRFQTLLDSTLFHRQVDATQRAAARLKGESAVFGAFDHSSLPALRDAYSDRLDAAKKITDLGWTRNEANEHLDLGLPAIPPDRGGDVGLVSFGNTPLASYSETDQSPEQLGKVATAAQAVVAAVAAGEQDAESAIAFLVAFFPITEEEAKAIIEPAAKWAAEHPAQEPPKPPPAGEGGSPPPPAAAAKGHRALDSAARRRRSTWAQLVTHVYAPGERDFATAVRKVFRMIHRDFQAFVEGARAARMSESELDSFISSKQDDWDAALRKLAHPVYGASSTKALKHLEGQLGGFDVVKTGDPKILAFLREKEIAVVQVNETQVANIRATLVEGMGETETVQQLGLRLDRELGFGETRAKAIARTEVASAANGSRQIAMKEEGVEATEWVSAGDDNVRDTHAEADGEVVGINDAFTVGDSKLRFPGDPSGPPEEIVNCRCATGPAE